MTVSLALDASEGCGAVGRQIRDCRGDTQVGMVENIG
jgi:hypothetical protein